jgi:hypothetical protein
VCGEVVTGKEGKTKEVVKEDREVKTVVWEKWYVCLSACLPVCMCIINTTLMKTSLACLPISAARRDLRIFPRWNLLDGIQFWGHKDLGARWLYIYTL